MVKNHIPNFRREVNQSAKNWDNQGNLKVNHPHGEYKSFSYICYMLCSFFIEIVLLNRDLEVKELPYELVAA